LIFIIKQSEDMKQLLCRDVNIVLSACQTVTGTIADAMTWVILPKRYHH